MDLLSKTIIVVAVIVIAVFVAYSLSKYVSFAPQVTEAQAESLVLHDLENANPGSVVNVTNATHSQYAGSWYIVASLVANATSPCPSYYIYSFDYPKYGFVYRVENTYTNYSHSGCTIYGLTSPNRPYPIGSYPVAIAKSYLLNLSAVNNFVSRYGFNKVVVKAGYYDSIFFDNANYSKVWLVNYTAPGSSSYVSVLLSQTNGTEEAAHSST